MVGPPPSGRGENSGPFIYIINVDGSGLTQLTKIYSVSPAWSPDGSKIVFNDREDLWLINADGSGLTQLTDDPFDNFFNAAWSPR